MIEEDWKKWVYGVKFEISIDVGEGKVLRFKKISEGGRNMKISRFLGFALVLIMVLGSSHFVIGEEPLFKDYNVAVVQQFNVPPNVAAPDTAGSQITEKIVFQVRRYTEKFNLFEMVVKEGTKEVPSEKKVLIIKGDVKEYSASSTRRRIVRSLIPGGEWTSTTAFTAHYQFIDKESGKVIYETDLRTTGIFDQDTVEYAMERNAEAAAKVITKYKGK